MVDALDNFSLKDIDRIQNIFSLHRQGGIDTELRNEALVEICSQYASTKRKRRK